MFALENLRQIETADLSTVKKALVRVDMDVTIENGKVLDEFRLNAHIPTLNHLLKNSVHVVICGHIGKPKGKVDPSLSTQQLQKWYEQKLISRDFEILENLRFDPREEANDTDYAQELANRADIYVNDSFATCHREHASIVGVPKLLPAFAGINLVNEVKTLNKVLQSPMHPMVVLIGGIKIESKMPVINKFLEIADLVLLGGKLGLNWQGEIPEKLAIPSDYAKDEKKDIGPETIEKYISAIKMAKSVVWAGPMGLYEEPEFAKGTREIAQTIADITKDGAFSLAGGGNTLEALNMFGLANSMSFNSTGGGAMLEYLAKGTLPGLEALKSKTD